MRNLCTVTKSNAHLLQLEKAHVQQGRPSAAKKKKKILLFFVLIFLFFFDYF